MSELGRHAGRTAGAARMRTTVAAVVAVVCAAVGIGSLAYAVAGHSHGPSAPAALRPGTLTAHTPGKGHASLQARGPIMDRSVPTHLSIPSVKIDTGLLRLGLTADGSLQVPWKPLLAGWYTRSPTPGELGPAVIAGHVDSWATGPAVFYRLGEVAVGSHVFVTRSDTSVADFEVTSVASYPKTAFPTHLVYGNVDRAELRLITCAGWNSQTQEYDSNVVVFARLVHPSA